VIKITEQFEKVAGIFEPRRVDDLCEGATEFIGWCDEWQASWQIEDGPFKGEWAMTPTHKDRYKMPFAWVPSGDLREINADEPVT